MKDRERFFESKCYEVRNLRDLYMKKRERFLSCAESLKESDYGMSSIVYLANEMQVAYQRYLEMSLFIRQMAVQFDMLEIYQRVLG